LPIKRWRIDEALQIPEAKTYKSTGYMCWTKPVRWCVI